MRIGRLGILLIQLVLGELEGLAQQGGLLTSQLPLDVDHAALVGPHGERAEAVLEASFLILLVTGHDAPVANEILELARCHLAGLLEQKLLGLGRGDPRHGPGFGVRNFAESHGFRDSGKTLESPSDADLLPGGTEIEAAPPGEPMRARGKRGRIPP